MNAVLRTPLVFLRQAYLAVTEFEFYCLIFRQPLLATLSYLVFLSLLVALTFAAVATWVQLPKIEDFVLWAGNNLPSISIQEGRLEVAGEQPLVLRYFGDQIVTFVYTEEQDLQLLEQLDPPAIVFQRDEFSLLVEGASGTWNWRDVAPFITLLSGPEEWGAWGQWLSLIFFPTVFLVQWVFVVTGRSMQALLLMFCAASVAARLGNRLSYQECFTISVYSLTPAFILNLGVTLAGQQGLLFDLIYLGIASVYTFLATQRCMSVDRS